MKRIVIVLALPLALAACGDTQEKKQPRKPPEERVISEPTHGFGVLFGKPNPDYTPPGRLVDSPDFKVTLPEDRWEEVTISKKEGKPSAAVGVDAYSHAWRSLNNIHADHSITSMPIAQ
ncbi:hypothetical protein ACV1DQ_20760, partial [Aeromonas allosaccharophila]